MDVSVLEQEIAQSARALGQYLEMQLDVDRMVDPLEKLLGDDGEVWDLINGGGVSEEDCSPYGSERQLSQVRKVCRAFASEHPFAICGHENRISYVIGEGHVYTVVAKQGEAGRRAEHRCDSGRKRGRSESAGESRHGVADERAAQ